MRQRLPRRGRFEALVLLALTALTVSVVAVSQFALPRGLRRAVNLRGASQAYTHQIAGYILVPEDGPYRLAIVSSGPSRLALNDNLIATVADPGGEAIADQAVPAGIQRLTIHYTPTGRPAFARPELRWTRSTDPPVSVPDDALAPRRLRPAEWTLRRWLPALAIALGVAWAGVVLWSVGRSFRRWFDTHYVADPGSGRVLTTLVALTLALHAYPLWWGLPVFWGQDELEPIDILIGWRERFANGWHTKYPPLQMYFLTALYLPLLGLQQLGLVPSNDPTLFPTFAVIGRTLTILMSVGTTMLVYLCGRLVSTPRAAGLSALTWTLVLPLTYYAKLANLDVPYTFWFALSLVAYIRAAASGAVRDFVLFGASAAAAVATKDQAYGLYLFPALHLAWTRLQYEIRGSSRLPRAFDRPLLAGTAAGILVFALAHNLVFNWQGFQEHVRIITGGASQNYRMIDSWSADGQAWLLAQTIGQIAWSMSVPGTLLVCAGLFVAWRDRASDARRLWTLTLPALSYYVTFIAVVGYVYDRFVLPLCLPLAVFAGYGIDKLWKYPWLGWKTAGVAALFVYMTWRTASIDLLMAADRRYAAEQWLRARLPRGAEIGVLEWHQMLPRLDGFRIVILSGPPPANGPRPETLVITGGYPKRYAPGGIENRWYESALRGEQGYRVALRLVEQPPLALLGYERPFREMDTRFTILPKVSPEIIVFVRESASPEGKVP